MSDFELQRETCEEERDYNVDISRFENDMEQRRQRTEDSLIGFRIKSPALTYTKLQEYLNFFNGKFGSLTSFTFTNPFDNKEYTVRFDGPIRTNFARGAYVASFDFKRLV